MKSVEKVILPKRSVFGFDYEEDEIEEEVNDIENNI
jgi:hypothetical protein